MLVCTACHLDYEEGKKFCRQCGAALSLKGDASADRGLAGAREKRLTLICPTCRVRYGRGTYCTKCGTRLIEEIETPEERASRPSPQTTLEREGAEPRPFDKARIKRLSRRESGLSREKKELEASLQQLENERGTLSDDLFKMRQDTYLAQFEDVSARQEQLEMQLQDINRKAVDEINRLLQEIKPLQQRSEEVTSLYRSGALDRNNFSRENKELRTQIRQREKETRSYQQLISLLPRQPGGEVGPPEKMTRFLRPLLFAAGGFVLLFAVAGYLVWPSSSYLLKTQFQPRGLITKDLSGNPKQASLPTPPPSPAQEVTRIRSVLENLRQANLKKDIDLFMSCYALDFNGREDKKLSTLENWKNHNYLDLSYQMKNPIIAGDKARVSVEWRMKLSSDEGVPPEENTATFDVALQNDKGTWKIREVKPTE